jgi:hypothetical protein
MTSIKITFNNETKKIKVPASFIDLVDVTARAFGVQNLPEKFKYCYTDTDGDVITITSQEDLDEALECGTGAGGILKLFIKESLQQSENFFDGESSFRSSALNDRLSNMN